MRLGLLSNGDYGLQVTDSLGNARELNTTVYDSTSQLTYSGTASVWGLPTALAGSHVVSVTAVCSTSGLFDIAIGAQIEPGSYAAGESAQLGTYIAGTNANAVYAPTIWYSVGANSTTSATVYAEFMVGAGDSFVPGSSYTFTTYAWISTTGVTATFSSVSLRVTPI